MRNWLKGLLAFCLLGGAGGTAQAALDASLQQVQNAQVLLLRASTDLFIHRGEGRHAEQAALTEASLDRLRENLKNLEAWPLPPAARELLARLQPRLTAFEIKVRETLLYAPSEPDLPWEFNFEYSKLQRELLEDLTTLGQLLLQAQVQPLSDGEFQLLDLPAKVQYLAMRYTARAYVGDIETLADQQRHYFNQDIDVLAKRVQAELDALAGHPGDAEQQRRLHQVQLRWKFIYGRLLDYNEDMTP
jgi:hypothetical protein